MKKKVLYTEKQLDILAKGWYEKGKKEGRDEVLREFRTLMGIPDFYEC